MQQLQQERKEWFEKYEAAIKNYATEAAEKQLAQWIEEKNNYQFQMIVSVFCKGISVVWGHFSETTMAAFSELWLEYQDLWNKALESNDSHKLKQIEEEIAHALGMTVQREADRISQRELKDAIETAEKHLGSEIWSGLTSEEQRLIATGLHCLGDLSVQQYAGLAFGQVVELSLSQRLFSPLRNALQKAGEQLPEDEEESKEQHFAAAQFFNGNRDHLMLGQQIGILGKVLLSKKLVGGKKPEHPVYQYMWNYLMALPQKDLLIVHDQDTRKFRSTALEHINKIRIDCAHPNPNPKLPTEARKSWDYLAGESENAFLRYFIGAHLN